MTVFALLYLPISLISRLATTIVFSVSVDVFIYFLLFWDGLGFFKMVCFFSLNSYMILLTISFNNFTKSMLQLIILLILSCDTVTQWMLSSDD